MSSQSVPLVSSGLSTPSQTGTTPSQAITTPTTVNSTDGMASAKSPVKASNPKVVVQPVNPPMSISLPIETQQTMFSIQQQKHAVETGKVAASVAIVSTPAAKPSQAMSRPVMSKTVTPTQPQPATYMVPSTQIPLGIHQVSVSQPVPVTHPTAGTHIVQSAQSVVPSTHLLATAHPVVPGTQSLPGSQARLPATAPNVTSASLEVHKIKVTGPSVQVVTSGTQPSVAGAPPGHHMQQYVRGLSMHPGIIPGTHVAGGQLQFPSHLPRGPVAAAAMSAPKSGMTTAILRTTSPVTQQGQFPNTATTIATAAIQSPVIAGQQLQRHHPPTQIHLPAQHHIPGRLHAQAGLAGVGMAPTGPPGITRASSPGAAASLPSHHTSSTEAHRTMPLPQTHVQTSGHPFRPDTKQLPKSDKKPDGKPDAKSAEPTKSEVKQTDPRSHYNWVTVTQQGSQKQQQQQQQLGGPKHASYISGLGMQRMTQQPPSQGPAMSTTVTGLASVTHGASHISSSLVTATTLSHHTVPSQSIIHSSVRTSAITVTTLSTQPQSTTTTSIPVAKVYPRQQITHPPRPPGPYVTESPYISAHSRNSPNTSIATTVTSLPPTVSMSDGRGDRPPHPGVMTHGGHAYPSSMPAYYFDSMNYRHPMMHSYGTPHAFTSMSAAGVRSTLAESHMRQQMHPSAQPNSAVAAAAVVAAAHVATGVGPVRVNPVAGLMIDPRRQVPVHNTMAVPPSLEVGNMHTSTATSVNASQSSSASPNPNASPRPSILKRRMNTDSAVIRKLIPTTQSGSRPTSPALKTELSRSTSSSPKHSDSLASSQHSIDSNASEASLDAPPSSLKIKQEHEILHSDAVSQASLGRDASLTNSIGECSPSPRKKPRKQQHKVATEHHDILDDQSTDEETETKHKHFRVKKEKKEKKPTVSDLDHVNVVHYFRRPCLRLIDTYRQSWKPTHNHFERYTDVRPKEEKKTTIHEIANQRGIVKKTDGWKVRHITYQFEDLSGLELDVFNEMKGIKEGMAPWQTPGKESDTSKIYELIQGNIQRSQYVMEHLEEAKNTMLKLLEHKPKVMSIIKSHANKRHAKKKHSP